MNKDPLLEMLNKEQIDTVTTPGGKLSFYYTRDNTKRTFKRSQDNLE